VQESAVGWKALCADACVMHYARADQKDGCRVSRPAALLPFAASSWGDPHLGELANHLENLIGTPDHVSAACHDMDFQAWRATLPRRERKVIDLRLRGLTMAETGLIIGKTTQQVFLILQDLKQQIPPALLVRPCKPAKGVR